MQTVFFLNYLSKLYVISYDKYYHFRNKRRLCDSKPSQPVFKQNLKGYLFSSLCNSIGIGESSSRLFLFGCGRSGAADLKNYSLVKGEHKGNHIILIPAGDICIYKTYKQNNVY